MHDRGPGRASRARAAASRRRLRRRMTAQCCSVDEFKGRIVRDRRWPAACRPRSKRRKASRSKVAGPRARLDHRREPGRAVPDGLRHDRHGGDAGATNSASLRPRRRGDPDAPAGDSRRSPGRGVRTRAAKERAVVEEIRALHATGRPVLVGTASVEESERLSRRSHDVPHQVLNARNEEAEAAIIARAGERGAVTISTNMAGRGVDIRLGDRGRGARRPACHRHEPAREPPHRSSAARPRRPAGRSRQLALLHLERRSADGEVRQRMRLAGSGAANRRGTEPRHAAAVAKIRNHRRSAAASAQRRRGRLLERRRRRDRRSSSDW